MSVSRTFSLGEIDLVPITNFFTSVGEYPSFMVLNTLVFGILAVSDFVAGAENKLNFVQVCKV